MNLCTKFLKYILKFNNFQLYFSQAYPTLKPLGSWFQDLRLRVQQFHDWNTSGIAPIKFWLPGFTSPKSLLNAFLLTIVKITDVSKEKICKVFVKYLTFSEQIQNMLLESTLV